MIMVGGVAIQVGLLSDCLTLGMDIIHAEFRANQFNEKNRISKLYT